MRIQLSCDDLLQRNDDVCADADRVNTVLRQGAVAALALHRNGELIVGVHHRGVVIVHEHTDRQLSGADVIRQRRVHLRVLQNAVFQHVQAAVEALLARLEHELNGSLQLRFMLLEHLRSGQKHGGVHIVPAAMRSLRVHGSKRKAALFRHLKRVHVCPQKQDFAALADQGGHSLAAALRFDSVFPQLLLHIDHRVWKRQSRLRVTVKVPSVLDQFVLQFQCSVIIAHFTACPFLRFMMSQKTQRKIIM